MKRIGLIAMSGVRVMDAELIEAGLNLPGFVERSKVIASLPSLSLLTLAALSPPEVEVEYRELAEFRGHEELPGPYDLVAISTFTAMVGEAYALADRYRAEGVPVVMGGLHVGVMPDEALEHCTSIVIGEGELGWPRLVADWLDGGLQPVYRPADGEVFELADAPAPRYDLLELERYNRLTVQTSRGCPHLCEFCASSPLLTPRYRLKPAAGVLDEIARIKRLWPRPFIEFADDNSFVNRGQAAEILEGLIDADVRWFTEADVSLADKPELLELMRRSGCRQVLIGLESPSQAGLEGLELHANWKARRRPDYERAVEVIQEHGITVNGCFILGLDGDDETIFDEIAGFVERTHLYETQITVLTPFPGTPLYTRLAREGRLLEERPWSRCTLFDVVYRPTGMSPDRLRRGLIELMQRVYEPDAVRRRREQFFRRLRQPVASN